jgi:hypothetical protein
MNKNDDNLLDELSSLYSGKSNQLILGNRKTSKKKKKQRARKYDEEGIGELLINGKPYEEAIKDSRNFEQERDLAQIAEIMETRDIDDFSSGLIRANKSKYGQGNKDENPYKDEFKDDLGILYDELESLKEIDRMISRMIENMTKGGRARNATKGLTDLYAQLLACKNTQTQVINHITNIKKDIVNFNFKDSKSNSADATGNLNHITSTFIDNLFNGQGRNTFLNKAYVNPIMGGLGDGNEPSYDDDEMNAYLDSTIEDMGDVRSDEVSAYIKYENLNPEICIRKHISGEWEFFARSQDTGEEIKDYPLPGKTDFGEISFTMDGTTATDSFGGVYPVITVGYDDVYINNDLEDYDPEEDLPE